MLFPKGTWGVTVSSAGWGQPAPGAGPSVCPQPWWDPQVRAFEPPCGAWAELRGPAAQGNCNSHPWDEGKEGQRGPRDSNVLKRQRQTYACAKGELGAEGPLLVKLVVLMGFTCLSLLCGGNCTFVLGLGFSWRLCLHCAEPCFSCCCAGKILVPEEFCWDGRSCQCLGYRIKIRNN